MLYLALAIACSLSIGMLFKWTGRRGMDRLALLAVNYAAALLLGFLLSVPGDAGALPMTLPLLALGGAVGALFILGFFLLALATEIAGMALALGVMRVAVILPFLVSWIGYGETPSAAQGAGLALAAVAFFLLARRENPAAQQAPAPVTESEGAPSVSTRTFGVLAALFLTSGCTDVGLKLFDEELSATAGSEGPFLMLVFDVAFLIGAAIVIWRGVRTGRWPRGETLVWGVVLGVVNYGSALFFIWALDELSGTFAFPANHIGIVLGAALLGVWVWDEHLSRLNVAGLVLAALALLLLSL